MSPRQGTCPGPIPRVLNECRDCLRQPVDAPCMSMLPPPPPEVPPRPTADRSEPVDRSGSTDPDIQRARMPTLKRHAMAIAIALGTFAMGVAAGIALPVTGTGSRGAEPSPTAAPLADAFDLCNAGDTGGEIADEQTTLILDTQGTDDATGVDYTAVTCVLAPLDTPERVTQAMESTRALDGRITDSWDAYTANWPYHPDTGLDLIISTP